MQQVNIVVPFAAGGGTDSTARLLAQKLSEKWGKSVIVENRPGGNTVIATQMVAKAKPDGHTLLIANSTFAINPILSPNLPYDSSKDFVPIGTVAGGPFMMLVHPSVPANDLKGMLTEEKNQLLTRVGPGTPMGSLLRRYWMPIAGVSEFENCHTKAIRLMGEDLDDLPLLYRHHWAQARAESFALA